MSLSGFLLTAVLLSLHCALAAAERVALVVGNSAYPGPLANPVNDAKALAAALKAAGFETTTLTDASLEKMEQGLVEFKKAATGARVAWFFYAGHGLEVQGSNYLVPVNADVKEQFQIRSKTLALDQVLGAMEESGAALRVVVLDCCRDNPLGRSFSRNGAGGLAALKDSPKGTIIAYATAPGKTAADGEGANSPFTAALVGAIETPGLDVDQIFKAAGSQVLKSTAEAQRPWISSSFFDSLVLVPATNTPPKAVPVPESMVRPAAPALPGGTLQTATNAAPFINALTMEFVPVKATPGLLWSRWETRVQDYKAFLVDTQRARELPSFQQGDDHPVVNVSFDDAQEFCAWLSKKEGRTYRLPTDHEWSGAVGIGARENAAASPKSKDEGVKGVYPWGTAWPPPPGSGNLNSSLQLDSFDETSPAGKFKPTADGLYDLSGNVWEWCDSPYQPGGETRVLRGGSWNDVGPASLLSSFRINYPPTGRFGSFGFRVVLVVGGGG